MPAIATLFDFNGVLIDDEAVHFAAFRDVLKSEAGIVIDEKMYNERYLGFDDAGAFRAMLIDGGRQSLTRADVQQLIDAKKPVYMTRIATELVIFDGAVELVKRRADRGKVGIVSGALRHEIEHVLGIMGVRDRISFIVAAEDVSECKPHPEGYLLGLKALDRANDDPNGVVVLEDSLAGVVAAKKAGLRCAAVTSSYPADRLKQSGADVVVDKLADLTDALFDGAQ